MEPSFLFDLPKEQSSIIKVFGVGGGGSNAVNHMYDQGIAGVNFVVLNTDSQALEMSRIPNKIQLGPALTQGLGAGAKPQVGAQAAEESIEVIKELLSKNTKMVFITAGMGGGTGTGAAPVVARTAREMGILTVGIVTTPFWFEGKGRFNSAKDGIDKLKAEVDTLLVINNDKIRDMYGNLTRSEGFGHANNILTTAAKAISEIITVPGEMNVDFADVETVMKGGGTAVMGSATAEGEDRAKVAVKGALHSPLLYENNIKGARRVLVNITTGTKQVTMDEIGAVMEFVQEQADNIDIDVVMGACDDPSIGEKLTVTLIATGFETKQEIGFSQVVEKVVHQLNDKIETTTVAQTVAPVNNVVAEVTLAEVDNVVLDTVNDELDFFAPIDITSEEANEFSVEFNVSRDEQKLLETFEAAATTQEIVEEQPIILAEQNVVEEEIITYHKRSYETETIQAYKTEELNKDLEDRKRVLAGLSYRVGNKQNLSDLENEPAYKRKGLDVNSDSEYSTQNEVSRYSVGNDAFDRPEIKKNNTYLHDNVD